MEQIEAGMPEFPCGTEDWPTAARVADRCVAFSPDVEEEQVADEARSCYNCRYRRWSVDSITCCRNGIVIPVLNQG